MIDNFRLRKEVEKYQQYGEWTADMHEMIMEIIKIVSKYNFTTDYDEWQQNSYVVLMNAAKMVDKDKDLFVYFYTCLVNMGRSSYTKQFNIQNNLKKYWEENGGTQTT